jgi:iron complex outermembrane receptor protein
MLLLTGIWGSNHALAQQTPAQVSSERSGVLEEITVTARKREENLQQVPVSVAAITAGEIEARSATSLSDIAQATPNIAFQQLVLGGSEASLIYIRGIGQSDVLITAEPGVGEYLDGVYLGRMQGIDLDMLDMARIEILRGPQGTLFGKNTIGGAINLVSAQPNALTNAVSGRVEALTGSFNRADGVFNVNIPVVANQLAIRFAGATRHDEGYGHRADGERTADTNKFSGRLSALYTPVEEWEFLAAVDGTNVHQHNGDYRLVHVGTPPLVQLYNKVSPIPYNAQWIASDPYSSNATGPNADRAQIWGAALTSTWHAGAFDLKSITSYRHNSTTNDLVPDGSPLGLFYDYDGIRQHQWSQELQASGTSFGDRFKWVGGLYYFQEAAEEPTSYTVYPMLSPFVGDLSFHRTVSTDNQDYAGYGQGTYSVLESLHVTVGLRYTYETKSVSAYQVAYSGSGILPLTARSANFHSLSPRLGLDYRWTPDFMTYVSAAQGYKSGGFNGRGASVADFNEFNPETDWTYEAGLRSDWLDKTLRINASVFYTKYSDIQVTENYATLSGTPLSIIANAASATIKGGELEILARPMSGVTLGANAGYTHAAYTSAVAPPGGLPPVTTSTHFVNTPQMTYSLSAEYAAPVVQDRYTVVSRVDFNHKSTEYFDISNSPYTTQRGYGLLNARLTFEPTQGPWSIAAFATNLTNRHFILGGSDVSASLGFAVALEGPPREWGVDVRYRF